MKREQINNNLSKIKKYYNDASLKNEYNKDSEVDNLMLSDPVTLESNDASYLVVLANYGTINTQNIQWMI